MFSQTEFYSGPCLKIKEKNISARGTHNNRLVQLPDQLRADQKLKHGITSIVHLPLKHWQA